MKIYKITEARQSMMMNPLLTPHSLVLFDLLVLDLRRWKYDQFYPSLEDE